MKNLKNNILIILFFPLMSCATQKIFSVETIPSTDSGETLNVISVSPNRIRQECQFLNAEAENSWRHQYMMYILNNKNDVIPVMHVLHQDKASCETQIKKIKKIYQKSSNVKLCLRGELKTPNPFPEKISFDKLGLHMTKYDEIWFQAICSEKDCFFYDKFTNTCPGFQTSY